MTAVPGVLVSNVRNMVSDGLIVIGLPLGTGSAALPQKDGFGFGGFVVPNLGERHAGEKNHGKQHNPDGQFHRLALCGLKLRYGLPGHFAIHHPPNAQRIVALSRRPARPHREIPGNRQVERSGKWPGSRPTWIAHRMSRDTGHHEPWRARLPRRLENR